MTPEIVHEDDDLLIINKPAGWIVNEAKTTAGNPVIQTWIKENFDFDTASNFDYRNGIVHRLDKETSGILIIAKTKSAFEKLQKSFKDRKVKKTYTALAHGKIEPKSGNVDSPVGRLPWNRERFGVLPGGRDATTEYEVDGYYKDNGGEEYSLVTLFPKTGRTHQIRIHLKHIGHPIVSDSFYAGRKRNRVDRKWCPRLFLHASQIRFTHPVSGNDLTVRAPLSEDLASALGTLTKL